jgi:DNA-binding MarR family transcriptional regulator
LDRSALGHNLRPLERDGLVEILEGERDRRRRNVALTSQGTAKFQEAKKLWQVAQARFLDVFGRPDGLRLRATLLRIANDDRLAALKD